MQFPGSNKAFLNLKIIIFFCSVCPHLIHPLFNFLCFLQIVAGGGDQRYCGVSGHDITLPRKSSSQQQSQLESSFTTHASSYSSLYCGLDLNTGDSTDRSTFLNFFDLFSLNSLQTILHLPVKFKFAGYWKFSKFFQNNIFLFQKCKLMLKYFRLLQLDTSFSKKDFYPAPLSGHKTKHGQLQSHEDFLQATEPNNVLLYKPSQDIHKRWEMLTVIVNFYQLFFRVSGRSLFYENMTFRSDQFESQRRRKERNELLSSLVNDLPNTIV